jgi:hypothetical protein
MEAHFNVTVNHSSLERYTGTFTVRVSQDAYDKTFYAHSTTFGCGKNYKTIKGAVSGLINGAGAFIESMEEFILIPLFSEETGDFLGHRKEYI